MPNKHLLYREKVQYAILAVLLLGILAISGVYCQVRYFEKEQARAEAILEQPAEQDNLEVLAAVSGPTEYLGKFKVTAYCPCEKCCGKWAKDRPTDENGKEIVYTSSGTIAEQGTTVSVDPNVISIGTKLMINGHEYIAQDTGNAVKGQVIDIYFNEHEDAVNFGCKELDVYIIEEATECN